MVKKNHFKLQDGAEMSKLKYYNNPPLIEYESLILPIVKKVQPRHIVETGVFTGGLSEKLLQIVESVQGTLTCIDLYSWHDEFKKLVASSEHIKWIPDLTEKILPTIDAADLYIFDGDHNYYTVLTELKISWELNQKAGKPYVAIVRGTGWPFAQRDAYRNPDIIPEQYLKPHSWTDGIVPDHPGLVKDGFCIDSMAFACEEGGDHNGVLTAVWKFLEDKKGQMKHVKIPGFFGISILFSPDAPWSQELFEMLKQHSDNLLLDQMEEVRLAIGTETCRMLYDLDRYNTHRQNDNFDTEGFAREMKEGKGKKQGLGTVSILMPTRNRPLLVAEALKSAVSQTYRDIEIIVINDAGEDLRPVIEKFHDDRIVYIEYPNHKGVSGARNVGIEKARGKYIAFLDDDDQFYPQHIEFLVNALDRSGYSVAYSDYFNVSRREEKDGRIVTFRKRLKHCINMDKDSLLIKIETPPLAMMIAKSCLEQAGVFDEALTRYEDWDLYIRLVQHFPFLHVTIPTAEYVVTEGYKQTVTGWGGFFLNSLLKIHRRYKHLVQDKPGITEEQVAFRDKSRYWAYTQLERMDDQQSAQLHLEKVMKEIIENSKALSVDDVRGAHALLWFTAQRYPENEELASLIKSLQSFQRV